MKKVFFFSGFLFTVFCNYLFPQISIASLNFYYSENFNTLANSGTDNTWTDNSTILGWYSNRTEYRASPGSSTAGALYSFGADASTERALGSLASSSVKPVYYAVKFVNNTLHIITQIPIQYTGEQWRDGSSATSQTLYFEYQVNATDIASGDWINVPQLDFTGPIATGTTSALDGNDPANKVVLSYTIPVTLNNGDVICFRFKDNDDDGYDHGLAIDDFTLDATTDPMPVELTSFTSIVDRINVLLSWKTATEINNFGFEIERFSTLSTSEWEKIGFVKGHGNSNSTKEYSYTDKYPKYGKYQYRLKQIDNDGSYSYSKTIDAVIERPLNFSIKNYPNPFNPETKITFELPVKSMVNLTVYNLIGQEVAALVNEELEAGVYERNFNAGNLPSGTYIYSLNAGGKTISGKMLLMK